jgi:hypothetical protein
MSINENTKKMIPFFRQLADDIENDEMTQQQLLNVGEMFMLYKFTEQTEDTDMSQEDMKKYLFTGWYIHTQINS